MTENIEKLSQLFKELVPLSGKADSLAGELVRAVSRIGYRFYNDGDRIGEGYGRETCNPAARFLIKKGDGYMRKIVEDMWYRIGMDDEYEEALDHLCARTVNYIEQHPELRSEPTPDFWDYTDPKEDVNIPDPDDEDYYDYDEDDEDYYAD